MLFDKALVSIPKDYNGHVIFMVSTYWLLLSILCCEKEDTGVFYINSLEAKFLKTLCL